MEYTVVIILILILGFLFTKRLNYKLKKANQLIVYKSTVLDVRSVLEFNRGHFKNSINIPLDLLSKNIDILKKESKPVVVVCSHGIRAASACTILKKNQIDCINGGSWNNLKWLGIYTFFLYLIYFPVVKINQYLI